MLETENQTVQLAFLLDHSFKTGQKTKQNISIAASSLLTFLSPHSRQPMVFDCNERECSITAVLHKQNENKTYKQALKDYDQTDSVSMSAGKNLYLLVSSVVPVVNYDSDDEAPNGKPLDAYTHLWSMTQLEFDQDEPTKTLLLSDFGMRRPLLEDVNQLMFLLGIQPFARNVSDDDVLNYLDMDPILERLSEIPFHDPRKMKTHLVQMGLDFKASSIDTPIWKQWTMLSFFLQVCSPINFSPIEGGHRTWAVISHLTGKPLVLKANIGALTGELFNPHGKTINPNCALFATFDTRLVFNEMTPGPRDLLGFAESSTAQTMSQFIKLNQNTNNKTTRIAFLSNFLLLAQQKGLGWGDTKDIFFQEIDIQHVSGKKKGVVTFEKQMVNKMDQLLDEVINSLRTKEPYSFQLKSKTKPDIFKHKGKPSWTVLDQLMGYLDFRFCNDIAKKSKIF